MTYKKVAFMGRLEKKAEMCEGPHQIRYAKCVVRVQPLKKRRPQKSATQEILLKKSNTSNTIPSETLQNTVKNKNESRPQDAGLRTVLVFDERVIEGCIASLKARDLLFVEGNLREVPINTLANTSVGFSKVFSENPYLVVSSYEGCLQKVSSVPRGALS